jgi:hypothetical protein
MAALPDNAIALIADDEVERYQVDRAATRCGRRSIPSIEDRGAERGFRRLSRALPFE